MKWNILAIVAAAAMAPFTSVAAPTVSNVTVSWTNDTVLAISYDLDQDAIVTIDISIGGVPLANDKYSSLVGEEARPVKAGTGRLAKWLPYKEGFNSDTLANVSATVTAWGHDALPPILAVALGGPSSVRFYTSVDRLPGGGLTNDLYKGEWLVMRKIPATGVTWRMGTPQNEVDNPSWTKCMTNEWPHNVTFTADYYMGVYECTRAQWHRIRGTSGTSDSWTAGDHDTEFRPIVKVNWLEVHGYCDWPTSRDVGTFMAALRTRARNAFAFDLPTDAQWEYACRAGSGSNLPNGVFRRDTKVNGEYICWYPGNSDDRSHTVGQMPHNGWGLYDVIGNVREWTLDVFSEPLEANETDPVGPVRPSGTSIYTAKAIERGGSFSSQWNWDANGQWLQRSAARFGNERQFSANDIGFRIACPAVYVPPVE